MQTGPLAITAGRAPLSPVNKGYRPRATTESGQRPRPMRQQTLDETGRHNKLDSHLGSSVDSENRTFSGPGVDGEVGESKEKGLPTIFKYQGSGKEVFVCGESSHVSLMPIQLAGLVPRWRVKISCFANKIRGPLN